MDLKILQKVKYSSKVKGEGKRFFLLLYNNNNHKKFMFKVITEQTTLTRLCQRRVNTEKIYIKLRERSVYRN